MPFSIRKIGDTTVPAVGFGCMNLSISASSAADPPPPEDNSLAVLSRAAELGTTFWDTSDAYGPSSHNEKLIGRWLAENPGLRSKIFLCTKFGFKLKPSPTSPIGYEMGIDCSPEHVRTAVNASLDRLGVDTIDLVYAHRVDPFVPIEHTVAAMAELVHAGKVRYIGLSECSATTLRRAYKIHPIAAIQMEFSPWALDLEDPQIGILTAARELDVKIVTYSPLGRGWLTNAKIEKWEDLEPFVGKIRMSVHPRFSREAFEGNLRLKRGLEEMAKEKGVSVGQLTLAWVLSQGDDFIAIPGTKTLKYLEDNAGAREVDFTAEDEAQVRSILKATGGAQGARYSEAFLKACFGDTPALEE
ncbi:Aldo-keto yakc [NADP(+)] [Cyphellophora attinorum]|uniref:Aldo-keto yakc [NADP(+)] n=1 Tax=Cyphellophora attinorum TaxID=1664694 RepID=A0A0N1HLZ1_9EURO|nr:Aldo-keto yakc [NADP(+)] [Phialophora attinorum]KPI38156.1 Aldo-keto yakc [NADP(+)] [Phialophora attinorum]